jgi:hypothetical protein
MEPQTPTYHPISYNKYFDEDEHLVKCADGLINVHVTAKQDQTSQFCI